MAEDCPTRKVQEVAMKCGFPQPTYINVEIPKKSRDRSFKVRMEIIGLRQSWAGYGPNRKTARKAAARKALPFIDLLRNAASKKTKAELRAIRRSYIEENEQQKWEEEQRQEQLQHEDKWKRREQQQRKQMEDWRKREAGLEERERRLREREEELERQSEDNREIVADFENYKKKVGEMEKLLKRSQK